MPNRRARSSAPTAKDRQSAGTKARLLEAARRLFAERGYHAVPVTEIARAAGVTHGMINAHFHAKAGLLYALVRENNAAQRREAAAAAAAPGRTMARLRRAIEVYASGDLADPALLAAMQAYSWEWPPETEAENRLDLEATLAPVAATLAEGAAAGELPADLDVPRAVRAIFALYTLGLRPAVHDGASAADCVDEIMAQVGMLLGLPAD